jgi:DNA mismatch repair ATPase MutS
LFTEKEAALIKALEAMDINDMTPMDALSKLNELKKEHGI